MTLKEIAAKAGVSVSTVSRVVNGKSTKAASQEVSDRIWQIVRENGYTPNESAQHLKYGALPETDPPKNKIYIMFARKIDEYVDPFFSELMRAIEKEAFARRYPIQTIMTDTELMDISLNSTDPHSAAMILGQISEKHLSIMKKQFRHLAYIGLNALPEEAQIDQVLCSGYRAARSAVAYLTGLGHRKILYIGETRNDERYQGYLDELKSAGVHASSTLAHQAPLSPQGGYQCMRQILKGEWDCSAIFCANDDTAIGVIRAITEHGLNVPKDISVIGLDDIEISRYISPMLTTIHIPIEEMGVQATKILFDRIEGGHKTPMKVKFPCSLSPRESCLPPKRK